MTKLSVNINKLATLRNARGQNNPNLIPWAQKIQNYGAQGVTIHPRPDERHIKRSDVFELKPIVTTEFNIEGYPSEEFISLINQIKPEQCTLVPDPPDVLTSNAGWRVSKEKNLLTKTLEKLQDSPTRVSVFVEPEQLTASEAGFLKSIGVDRVELYTEEYAKKPDDKAVLEKYRKISDLSLDAGLELNAGHDLNYQNLTSFLRFIPEIKEVSIGHAIVCEALDFGMQQTIKKYLNAIRDAFSS